MLRWSEPPDLDSPLLTEREAQALLSAVADALAAELPGARLVEAVLEDGSSASDAGQLATASAPAGATAWRWVRLVAMLPARRRRAAGAGARHVEQGAREARRLQPRALARALADRLAVRARGSLPERESGDVVLAPAVAARLLAGLLPLLVGPEARERACAAARRRRPHRLAAALGGRRRPPAGGLLAAAVDGEGVPTRAVPLVEARALPAAAARLVAGARRRRRGGAGGERLQPRARACATCRGRRRRTSSCARRRACAPATLVGERRARLLPARRRRAGGASTSPATASRCRCAASGSTAGAARAPLAGGWLCGSIGGAARGVAGVARDLAFLAPRGGG